ncbi:MAG: squalene synthase HpnC [Planctomycetaceae bacterium]|nr:squalene synthase HpnC [Planctomycetaceae bacterium]
MSSHGTSSISHLTQGSVTADLPLWGPDSNSVSPSRSQAELYCKSLATSHYENFPVVTWLLPHRYHQPFYNIYAFCRWSDDLGDEINDPAESLRLLDWWRAETLRCFEGAANHPVFVALLPTIDEYHLDRQPFLDLISAFEQDQCVTEYQNFDQLLDYCTRSANPVGRILLRLFDRDDDENVRLSDSICTGLQLANFWQDVRRDLEIGRLYLPLEDLRSYGVDFEQFRSEDRSDLHETPEFVRMMQFQVERARQYLKNGLPLGRRLPGRIGLEIELFARGGLAILDKIAQQDYRVLTSRPKLGKRDLFKLSLSLFRRLLSG